MAKINHLEMGADVMALNDVRGKERFHGFELSSSSTNQPTV